VLVTDLSDLRLDVARHCGLHHTSNAKQETLPEATRRVFGEKPRVAMRLVQDRELTLVGTLIYRYQDYERAVELMSSGEVVTSPLESAHFPFEKYPDAYDFIDRHREESMKVFVDVSP